MEGVRKVYEVGGEEVVALAGADLTVGADEIVALVGPSGSGKTTLCSIAGGLLTPTAGSVDRRRGGHLGLRPAAAHRVPARLRRLRLPDRQPDPVPHRRENLLVVDEIGPRTGARARARADQLLEELGLADRARQPARPSSRAASGSGSPSAGR